MFHVKHYIFIHDILCFVKKTIYILIKTLWHNFSVVIFICSNFIAINDSVFFHTLIIFAMFHVKHWLFYFTFNYYNLGYFFDTFYLYFYFLLFVNL